MKRAVISIAVAAVVLAGLGAVFFVKHVPSGYEGLRVDKDGTLTAYPAGFHLVKPGYDKLLRYPVGKHTYRHPESGTFTVRAETGDPIEVAFSVSLDIPPGSAATFYQRFSSDFEAAVGRVVEAAAGMEAASRPASTDPRDYLHAVADAIRGQLDPVGVRVQSVNLESWNGAKASAAAGGAGGAAAAAESVTVAPKPPRRVVIVGIDGGDWLNIRPLVAAGKLPHFKTLLEKGATGPLRSIEPILSPLVWTTIATGKYPEDHGVLNFTVVDPKTGAKRPITRYARKVDAFWNMLGDYGRTVCIAGWLATDPAETINGVMVTDKVGYLAFAPAGKEGGVEPGSVYPPDRAHEIEGQVVHGPDVTYDEIQPIIHIDRDEFARRRAAPFDPHDSVNNLILLYASTLTYRNVGLDLLKHDHPDVLAVYFEWIDAVSHLFMLQSPPRMPEVSKADYAKFKDAVSQAYVVQDRILGQFMDKLGKGTVLVVVSDHGFKSGAARLKNRPEIWAGNAAKWHRLNGIVAFYGDGVKAGVTIEGASVLDITPTVLALAGLPQAADMPGKVLKQAFDPSLVAQFNSTTVATLERKRADETPPAAAAGGDKGSQETMKKLEALGYVSPDSPEAHNNLGQRYQQRERYEDAIEEYKKAIALKPNFYSAYNNIAVCYGKLKRYDEAEKALRKAIEIKPDDFYAMNNLAVMCIQERRMDAALEAARKAVKTEPGYVNGHVTLGTVCAMTGRLDEAEREFKAALRLDPQNKAAKANLARLAQQRKESQ